MNLIKTLHKTRKSKQFRRAQEFVLGHKRFIRIFALAAVSGTMIINGIMQQPEIINNKEHIAQLKDSLKYEDERVEEVERLQDIVGTDEYIEKIAREKLGMVKEDEKLFIDVSKED